MSKVKVLHIHTRAVIGGSGTNTLLSMEGLDKGRFETVLACGAAGPLIDEAKKKGLRVEVIRHLANELNVVADILAFTELVCLIKKERFHIVHTHNSKAGILGRIAAKCCGVPIIIHTLHSCVFLYPNLNRLQRRLFLYLEKLAALTTDRLITISRPLQEEFTRARVASANKFVTIYSGIEIEKFSRQFNDEQKKEELGISPSELIVGTVARLEPGKGHKVFLQAASLVARENLNVKFMLVGDGPLRKELENFSQTLGIAPRCIFTGLRKDIAEITSIFDVAVLASFYEGMGRVLLEAQAQGKPVVATKVGGIPDIVNDGVSGILVSPGDVEALAQAMTELLNNPALRTQMAEAAVKWVGFNFSKQKMVNDIVKIYEQLIEKRLKVSRAF